MIVKEILPDGRSVVNEDGDVMPRSDFDRDQYPDPTPEQIRASETLRSIDAWKAADEFSALSKKGSNDPEVRRMGGVRKLREIIADKRTESREIFLSAHGFPSKLSDDPKPGELDAYYKGVNAWSEFRESISNEEKRLVIEQILSEN